VVAAPHTQCVFVLSMRKCTEVKDLDYFLGGRKDSRMLEGTETSGGELCRACGAAGLIAFRTGPHGLGQHVSRRRR
jgi:hypothetical protein